MKRSVKLSAITFGEKKTAGVTWIAFLLLGGRRGMGLLCTCNTACNISYNTATIVKILPGMMWGSWDSGYWIPDTLCHQACSLSSKGSLPLLSSR